jgi:sortase (surface protein transpeptidase)
MTEVLGTSTSETLTLITCTGTFGGGEYDRRLVVRATGVGVVKP